jgi:hypothetical protein
MIHKNPVPGVIAGHARRYSPQMTRGRHEGASAREIKR